MDINQQDSDLTRDIRNLLASDTVQQANNTVGFFAALWLAGAFWGVIAAVIVTKIDDGLYNNSAPGGNPTGATVMSGWWPVIIGIWLGVSLLSAKVLNNWNPLRRR